MGEIPSDVGGSATFVSTDRGAKEPTKIPIVVLGIDVLFLCVFAGGHVRPGGFKILFVNIYIWLA